MAEICEPAKNAISMAKKIGKNATGGSPNDDDPTSDIEYEF